MPRLTKIVLTPETFHVETRPSDRMDLYDADNPLDSIGHDLNTLVFVEQEYEEGDQFILPAQDWTDVLGVVHSLPLTIWTVSVNESDMYVISGYEGRIRHNCFYLADLSDFGCLLKLRNNHETVECQFKWPKEGEQSTESCNHSIVGAIESLLYQIKYYADYVLFAGGHLYGYRVPLTWFKIQDGNRLEKIDPSELPTILDFGN